ncbi:MAG: sulfotransferase [Deinococcales bacterium]
MTIYGQRKRHLYTIKNFQEAPDLLGAFPELADYVRLRYTLDLNPEMVPELTIGEDFSLGFAVNIAQQLYVYKHLVFKPDDDSSQIIFIVGSPRSGTSILGNTLSQVLTGSHQYAEGHVLALLNRLSSEVDAYYNNSPAASMPKMMLAEVGRYNLISGIQALFKKEYQRHHGPVVVDKTPGLPMLHALPYILQTWPQAKVIFAKRRALENITSRLKKFPQVGFQGHCQQWTQSMQIWQQHGKLFRPHQALEIDQYDIQTKPQAMADKLGHFLSLSETQIAQIQQLFIHHRPEQTRSDQEMSALSLEDMAWTGEEKDYFRSLCSEMLRLYGYSEDENYYARS